MMIIIIIFNVYSIYTNYLTFWMWLLWWKSDKQSDLLSVFGQKWANTCAPMYLLFVCEAIGLADRSEKFVCIKWLTENGQLSRTCTDERVCKCIYIWMDVFENTQGHGICLCNQILMLLLSFPLLLLIIQYYYIYALVLNLYKCKQLSTKSVVFIPYTSFINWCEKKVAPMRQQTPDWRTR